MKTVLVLFVLSIQSSYAKNSEAPASDDAFDTVQFYSSNGTSWRIKTFAADEDVHIWSITTDVEDLVALARSNTEKHYGDVIAKTFVIETESGLEGVRHELAKHALTTHLEMPPSGAVFWAPVGTRYRSKSAPAG